MRTTSQTYLSAPISSLKNFKWNPKKLLKDLTICLNKAQNLKKSVMNKNYNSSMKSKFHLIKSSKQFKNQSLSSI